MNKIILTFAPGNDGLTALRWWFLYLLVVGLWSGHE